MKKIGWRMAAVMAMLLVAEVAGAQQAAPAASGQQTTGAASAQTDMGPVANTMTTRVKTQLGRFSKIMVAAAEAMPAEKDNFKPTPEMNAFGHLVMHITQSNNFLCAKISGMTAPDAKLAGTDPKDKLVAGLRHYADLFAAA